MDGGHALAKVGVAVAGAVVHLTLQRGCHLHCALGAPSQSLGRYWMNVWEIDGVTDADGVARAALPLRLLPTEWRPHLGEVFRVLSTYDGGPGTHPQHAGLPLELTRED